MATILLVEDNDWDARLTVEALRRSPNVERVEVARDGEAALDRLRGPGASPSLILLDLNLPRKDGREVLAEVKADDKLRRIPVLVLTTSGAERDVRSAYDLHANAYIRKPADPDDYARLVEAIEGFWFGWSRLSR